MVVICTIITVVIMVMIMIRPWVMLYGGDGNGEAHGQRWFLELSRLQSCFDG